MTRLRGFAYATLLIAFAHLVFGGIVRISGSGMGCGDHWPKCYGRWFPPMDRMDLVIEISHRYLAAFLILSIAALVVAAFLRRAEPGVGGPGGVLRAASAALAVVVTTALFGALTVFMGNPPHATVAHWVLAAALFGLLAATVIRAGGLGGDRALAGNGSAKTVRSALAAVVVALFVIALGGLTAKVPHAAVACPSFPLCGESPAGTPAGVTHIQLTHRILAFLLFFVPGNPSLAPLPAPSERAPTASSLCAMRVETSPEDSRRKRSRNHATERISSVAKIRLVAWITG